MRLRRWLSATFEVALPSTCLNCDDPLPVGDPGLCRRCWDRLTPVTDPCCPHCAGPTDEHQRACLSCEETPPAHHGAIVWGEYHGVLRDAIIALKHHRHDELAAPLASRLSRRIRSQGWTPNLDLVTAVPSHFLYRIRRGYSAAEMIASHVARDLELSSSRTLKRRDFGRQAQRTRSQRATLHHRAFTARTGARRIKDQHILLIDDVTTTGATLQRASRVLISAGAKSVRCAALARTPDPRRMQ